LIEVSLSFSLGYLAIELRSFRVRSCNVRERLPCEFLLFRYVPDVVKGEFTNIGVLLREVGQAASATVRFTRDWSRVKCMDADADVALLEALEGEIGERLRLEPANIGPMMALLQDTLSTSVQMTPMRACLAESVVAEMELLMRMYVEPRTVKLDRKRTGRAAIAVAMRTQFERGGVWGLMRKRIAASLYTLPGDPMKIDCGYRPNGVVKMFHAVSLEADAEAAKVLAYTAPQLSLGVLRVEGARLELTAVIEPLRAVADENEPEAVERYRFAVETMDRQQIRVMTVTDLPRIADAAKLDLRV
jgi:hypothetical protein